MIKRRWFECGLIAIVLAGLALRLIAAGEWRAPAGDGIQYYALSQELLRAHRFALYQDPGPLLYTRLPGYPLFLAWVAVRHVPLDLAAHLALATRANAWLDVGTALAAVAIARALGASRAAQLAVAAAVLACPLMVLLSRYGLSESLATLLTTLAVWLVLRARASRPVLNAALAGVVAGAAQLVRADTLTLVPAVVIALYGTRRRWAALAAFAIAALVVFSPWPLRNLAVFGAPHPFAAAVRTAAGVEIPGELYAWARTWASSAPGDAYLDKPFVWGGPVDVAHPLLVAPAMYDDQAERGRLVELYQRYNRDGFSDEVRDGFARLARERRRRHPLRYFVTLPLARVAHLFAPEPESELPMRCAALGLPRLRGGFAIFDFAAYALAIAGALALARRDRRALAVLLAPVASRAALFAFAIPHATTQRYLVEVYPLLIVLAAGAARLLSSSASILDRGTAPTSCPTTRPPTTKSSVGIDRTS
jgi:4-amino-4-deoxy-L-arabinose transferase-like glycosyltransferase